MKLRLRGALVAIFVFCFSVFNFSTPVFADPVTTPETTAPTTTTTEDNTTTPADEEANADGEEDGVIPIEDQPTCADQIGGLAWLVCPGTGFLANVVDGAYDLLTRLIEVEPVTSDTESPFYLIWGTCRKLTNIVFIIMMLICILSQITGIGISNYGIKRTLPKLLAVAILANLSFMLCRIGIDLSNILGDCIRSIFEFVEQESFANGALSADFQFFNSWENIVTTFLGVGTGVVASAAVLANVGGFTGLLWLILPVLLGAVVSIVSAVLIMAGRQALIYILLMISPIAIVAYAMPNLSKWTSKWYQLFMRMLFFYPMFSALYGASRLAGLVVMCSAKDAVGVVLGLAIQVIPLFMSIPLMKMSGTFLNKIDGIVHGISAPAMRSFGHMADQKRAQAYQRQRFSNSPMLHTRLARYLQQRETDRVMDTRALEAINRDTYERRSKQGYFNRNGQLNRRGVMMNEINAMQIKNEAIRLKIDNDFDEGFDTDMKLNEATGRYEFKDHRVNRSNAQSIARANATIPISLRERAIEKARAVDINRNNIDRLATGMRNSLNGLDTPEENQRIRGLVEKSFNLSADDAEGYKHAKNVVLANAISQKAKIDEERTKEYFTLYNDTTAGKEPFMAAKEAMQSYLDGKGDANQMVAALKVMELRGDNDLLQEVVRDNVKNLMVDASQYDLTDPDQFDEYNKQQIKARRFQKRLWDTLIPMKNANSHLAAYAKAMMIRTAKATKSDEQMALKPNDDGFIHSVIDFMDFRNGDHIEGESLETSESLSEAKMQDEYSNGDFLASQDRTTLKAELEEILTGKMRIKEKDGKEVMPIVYKQKYVAGSALSSGKMEGEQLANFIKVLTLNFDTKRFDNGDQQTDLFKGEHAVGAYVHHKDVVVDNLTDILEKLNPGQLAKQKTDFIDTVNKVFMDYYGDADKEDYYDTQTGKTKKRSKTLMSILSDKVEALKSKNTSMTRNSISNGVRDILDIYDADEQTRRGENIARKRDDGFNPYAP